MKQETLQVNVCDEKEKKKIMETGVCLIRDWKYGMFEVPRSMVEEFTEKTGYQPGAVLSACSVDISKEDIQRINMSNWPSVYDLA